MVSMSEKRFEEIIENINKHNILNSLCGGMSSYDCMISELCEYTLELKSQLQQRDDVINECKKHVSSLSSKGRDCMIYADVKKDILNILNKKEDH